jgi:hypothetical protein
MRVFDLVSVRCYCFGRMRISAAVVVGLLCLATAAHAQQPSAKFTDEYQAGIDAYRLGKYDEAKTHLEAAKAENATLPGPWRWLAAVAQVEGSWPDCVASAREALRLNPKSSEAPATRKLHDECRAAWGKPAFEGPYDVGQGALAVTTDQVGASVEVNKLKYGSTPMQPRVFSAGDTEVTVTKTGFLPATRKVTILEGVVTDVDFILEVDPAAASTDVGTPTAELKNGWVKVVTTVPSADIRIDGQRLTLDAQGRYEIEAGNHEVTVTAPGHEGVTKKVHVTKGQMITVEAPLREQASVDASRQRGAIAVGAGVGLVVVGAISGIVSLRASDQARDWWAIETTRPSGDTGGIEPIHTRAEVDAANQRAKTWAIISDIGYGAGIAAIAVGAYFLVKGRPAGDRATLSVVPTHGGAAAVGEVRW